MVERGQLISRRQLLKGGVIVGGIYCLDRMIQTSSSASPKEINRCEVKINVDFVAQDNQQIEMVWTNEGREACEQPDEDIVNWYQYIGQLDCPLSEAKFKLIGEGHPQEVGFQRFLIKDKESTLVWVKRYESSRGEVPHKDDRVLPFYTRPGDCLGNPAGFWHETAK